MRTFGELVSATLRIATAAEAIELYDAYRAELEQHHPRLRAEDIARGNIGYCFGEGMRAEVRAVWEGLGFRHPYVHPWTDDPTELLRHGYAHGRRMLDAGEAYRLAGLEHWE